MSGVANQKDSKVLNTIETEESNFWLSDLVDSSDNSNEKKSDESEVKSDAIEGKTGDDKDNDKTLDFNEKNSNNTDNESDDYSIELLFGDITRTECLTKISYINTDGEVEEEEVFDCSLLFNDEQNGSEVQESEWKPEWDISQIQTEENINTWSVSCDQSSDKSKDNTVGNTNNANTGWTLWDNTENDDDWDQNWYEYDIKWNVSYETPSVVWEFDDEDNDKTLDLNEKSSNNTVNESDDCSIQPLFTRAERLTKISYINTDGEVEEGEVFDCSLLFNDEQNGSEVQESESVLKADENEIKSDECEVKSDAIEGKTGETEVQESEWIPEWNLNQIITEESINTWSVSLDQSSDKSKDNSVDNTNNTNTGWNQWYENEIKLDDIYVIPSYVWEFDDEDNDNNDKTLDLNEKSSNNTDNESDDCSIQPLFTRAERLTKISYINTDGEVKEEEVFDCSLLFNDKQNGSETQLDNNLYKPEFDTESDDIKEQIQNFSLMTELLKMSISDKTDNESDDWSIEPLFTRAERLTKISYINNDREVEEEEVFDCSLLFNDEQNGTQTLL